MSNEKFYPIYKELFEKEYHGSPIWKLIQNSELTAVPHFCGPKYSNCKNRIMVVGRAVNGWEVEFPDCSSLDKTLSSVLEQPSRFNDIVNEEGIKYFDENTNQEKTYYYSKSAFWRLIKKILIQFGEEDDWNLKILWSNLYKVAPRKAGNPAWDLIKPSLQTYIDCIKEEIKEYVPTHIVFITDTGYFNPYKKLPTFGDALNVKITTDKQYVVGSGIYNNSKIVVCKRPERRNTDDMTKEIMQIFNSL